MGFDTAFSTIHGLCRLFYIQSFPGSQQEYLLLPERKLMQGRIENLNASFRNQ